jgi:hypothetical protein
VLDPKVIAEEKKAAKRGRPRRPVAQATDLLVGVEYIGAIKEHLARLRAAGDHPNRTLHYDTVLVTLLLGFFNPTDNSLRMLEDLSSAEASKPLVGDQRVARSTLSDALSSMDPELLLPIIKSLMARLPGLKRVDQDLADLLKTIVAADGSVFTTPADVLWAINARRSNGNKGGQIRLNMQLDVLRFVPVKLSVSGADEGNEADALAKQLLAGVIYVSDRNFVDFDFMHAVLDIGSDFVIRLKADTTFAVVEERPLTQEDCDVGITSDRIGRLSSAFNDQRLFREVVVIDPRSKKPVRFLTTLLDVPALVIGKLYRHRWMVELFFKWLKCVAKLRHLINHTKAGITTQFYLAVIMVLLTYLRTGHKPGVYETNCLGWVGAGIMSAKTMGEVLARRQRERDLANARLARKKAAAAQSA